MNDDRTTRSEWILTVAAAAALLALPGRAPAAEPTLIGAPEPVATGQSDERIICRKTAEVGSLVRRKKECFTKAEWDKIAEAHQRGARKLMDGLTERYSCDPEVTDC